MRVLVVLLISSFIIKDIIFISDPFIIRGISQFLCLIGVFFWLFSRFSARLLLFKYWIYWCYIIILLVSSFNANNIVFVFIQVISVISVVLFFIAYYESGYVSRGNIGNCGNDTIIFNTSAILIGLIVIISLFLFIIYPDSVLDFSTELRFRGLYGKSAMIASVSSVLVGIALFGNYNIILKTILILSGMACLILTMSRTFWIATVISMIMVLYIYKLISKNHLIIGVILLSTISFCVYLLDVQYGRLSKIERPESISNLTGRTDLWKMSIKAFYDKPLLGYGLTSGSESLSGKGGIPLFSKQISSGRDMSKRTLHSGYIQSLLDVGFIGSIFYIMIIMFSIKNIIQYDKERKYPTELYILIFMAVANMGESMIYAASSYSAVLFWAMSIKSFSLKRANAI